MAIEIGKIRNVGFVGHGGVGKTSLVEALLFSAGATTRLGKVDDGSTTTDFDPDEVKRKISLNTAVAYCDWKGHRLNFVDTPGYGDFISDARAGLRAVEAAVGVVDAAAGAGKVIPVLAAAATKSIGSHPLLDLIVESFPSPADRGEVEGIEVKSKAGGRRPPDPKAPMAALGFKTVSGPHVGKLSIFRGYPGPFTSDSQ